MATGIAREVRPQVMRVSLAELKALGRFVCWEDVPKAIEPYAEGGARSYPLFNSWLPPNEWIDVLDGQTWKRLRFVAYYPEHENDTVVVSEGGKNRIIAIDRWGVAPAGYFTDCRPDMANATHAKLLLSKFEEPGKELREAWVKDVRPPYITFEVWFYKPNDRTDWFGDVTMHAADPRIRIDGVKYREPIFNHTIAVSHRWMTPADPDPDGAQYRELMQLCSAFDYCDDQVFLIDYMSLPQASRSVESERFKHLLAEFQEYFSRRSFVLNTGAVEFETRAWCMLELMLAAIEGNILNRESFSDSIQAASNLAKEYKEQSGYHQYNLAHPPRADDRNKEVIYWQIEATADDHRRKIEDVFLNQLEVTKEEDRSLIIDLLRTLCFERRTGKHEF